MGEARWQREQLHETQTSRQTSQIARRQDVSSEPETINLHAKVFWGLEFQILN
jgi:hypothetical protein